MTTVKIPLPSGDLASRRLAIAERQKIEFYLNDKVRVEVDLKDVESISESYSDELFGVLVAKLGLGVVLELLQVSNANNSALKSIATVMQRRNHEHFVSKRAS
ncbi:STAS-like domain-containing protein [Serratia sp. NPDC078593]|uniref:STAS-like domain-containing protein n=1 Tax=unclassified Serratia (in: enterobacteria) TaxID=2647522 RepID=UPI0037D0CE69